MTVLSSTFLVLAVMMAILNWLAVARENSLLEYVSKPAATTSLLITALSLDVVHDAPWGWRVAALALCIFGDVFLMLPRDAFVPGLASFAVAQILFTISFATGDTVASRWIMGAVIAVPVALILWGRFSRGLRASGHSNLIIPVSVYVVVISAMTIGAIASGSALAILGAVIFMVSDSLIAESRFVKSQPWHSVGIMVTYHFALTGLVLSLL